MTDAPNPSTDAARQRANRVVAVACVACVSAMAGAAYAAAPLYELFCKATGFGGTPRIATQGSNAIGERIVTVRFDANVQPGLTWRFEPEMPSIDVRMGETTTMFYTIRNIGKTTATGIAAFNVLPELAGGYFNKIQCFCFADITLRPGETIEAPVVFFIDPALAADRDLKTADTITLSYSFFPVRGSPKPLAGVKDPTPPQL